MLLRPEGVSSIKPRRLLDPCQLQQAAEQPDLPQGRPSGLQQLLAAGQWQVDGSDVPWEGLGEQPMGFVLQSLGMDEGMSEGMNEWMKE